MFKDHYLFINALFMVHIGQARFKVLLHFILRSSIYQLGHFFYAPAFCGNVSYT